MGRTLLLDRMPTNLVQTKGWSMECNCSWIYYRRSSCYPRRSITSIQTSHGRWCYSMSDWSWLTNLDGKSNERLTPNDVSLIKSNDGAVEKNGKFWWREPLRGGVQRELTEIIGRNRRRECSHRRCKWNIGKGSQVIQLLSKMWHN